MGIFKFKFVGITFLEKCFLQNCVGRKLIFDKYLFRPKFGSKIFYQNYFRQKFVSTKKLRPQFISTKKRRPNFLSTKISFQQSRPKYISSKKVGPKFLSSKKNRPTFLLTKKIRLKFQILEICLKERFWKTVSLICQNRTNNLTLTKLTLTKNLKSKFLKFWNLNLQNF